MTSAFVGIVTAGAADAEPSEPPTCSFTLTPPQLVQVSGADMVAATVTMASCDGLAAPISSFACIQAEGSDSAPQCVEGKGQLPAQVYYQPYRPGMTLRLRWPGLRDCHGAAELDLSDGRPVHCDTLGRRFGPG